MYIYAYAHAYTIHIHSYHVPLSTASGQQQRLEKAHTARIFLLSIADKEECMVHITKTLRLVIGCDKYLGRICDVPELSEKAEGTLLPGGHQWPEEALAVCRTVAAPMHGLPQIACLQARVRTRTPLYYASKSSQHKASLQILRALLRQYLGIKS